MVLGDAVVSVRDLGLLKDAILVLADKEISDMLLEVQFRSFFAFSHMIVLALNPPRKYASAP